MHRFDSIRGALLDAWAIIMPTECSGCGAPDRALCADCRTALLPAVHFAERGGIPVWCALDYAGSARQVIGAFKDGGRTDAAAALAVPLRAAVSAALAAAADDCVREDADGVHLVTIPSSRRSWRVRGYHPVDLLLRRSGLAPAHVLRALHETKDQVGLDSAERDRNRAGSLVAVRSLRGFRCLVVDDILTTGATVREARRAVTEAGGEVVGTAVLAETRLRRGVVDRSPETH